MQYSGRKTFADLAKKFRYCTMADFGWSTVTEHYGAKESFGYCLW